MSDGSPNVGLLIGEPYSFHKDWPKVTITPISSNITQDTDLIRNLLKLSERKPLNQVRLCRPTIQPPGGSEDYKFQTSLDYKVSLRSTWSAQQDPISKQTRAAKPLTAHSGCAPAHTYSNPCYPGVGKAVF